MDLDFDLDLLRVLVAVVDRGSVAAAARTLSTSRATIRRRLATLEAQAGAPLLIREGDDLQLTAAGQLLFQGARSVITEANALLAQVPHVDREPHGLVRMAVSAGEPPLLAGLALGAARRRWPKVHFEVVSAPEPYRLLPEHADMALCFDLDAPQGPWEKVRLIEAELHLLASPAYLKRHGTPSTIADLTEHELLAFRAPGGGPLPLLLRDGRRVAFPATPALTFNSVQTLRKVTVMGQGIGWFPDGGFTPPDEPRGALVKVMPDLVGGICPYWLLLPNAYRDIPRLRVLADVVVEVITRLRQKG